MPTYEYACVECGHHIEVVQSMSDPPLAVCTACGGRLRKVFSPIGIVFKGSGFYRTDSRGKSSTAKDGASTKEAATAKTESSSSSSSSPESGGSASKSDSSASSKPTAKPAEKSA